MLTDGTQTFLRFDDDFATDNGPDLNVYLSAQDPTTRSATWRRTSLTWAT